MSKNFRASYLARLQVEQAGRKAGGAESGQSGPAVAPWASAHVTAAGAVSGGTVARDATIAAHKTATSPAATEGSCSSEAIPTSDDTSVGGAGSTPWLRHTNSAGSASTVDSVSSPSSTRSPLAPPAPAARGPPASRGLASPEKSSTVQRLQATGLPEPQGLTIAPHAPAPERAFVRGSLRQQERQLHASLAAALSEPLVSRERVRWLCSSTSSTFGKRGSTGSAEPSSVWVPEHLRSVIWLLLLRVLPDCAADWDWTRAQLREMYSDIASTCALLEERLPDRVEADETGDSLSLSRHGFGVIGREGLESVAVPPSGAPSPSGPRLRMVVRVSSCVLRYHAEVLGDSRFNSRRVKRLVRRVTETFSQVIMDEAELFWALSAFVRSGLDMSSDALAQDAAAVEQGDLEAEAHAAVSLKLAKLFWRLAKFTPVLEALRCADVVISELDVRSDEIAVSTPPRALPTTAARALSRTHHAPLSAAPYSFGGLASGATAAAFVGEGRQHRRKPTTTAAETTPPPPTRAASAPRPKSGSHASPGGVSPSNRRQGAWDSPASTSGASSRHSPIATPTLPARTTRRWTRRQAPAREDSGVSRNTPA